MRKFTPLKTPGSVGVAIVVGLMFVTPVLAATTLNPVMFSFSSLMQFLGAHQWELLVGFSLMTIIALLLRSSAEAPRVADARLPARERRASGLDGSPD